MRSVFPSHGESFDSSFDVCWSRFLYVWAFPSHDESFDSSFDVCWRLCPYVHWSQVCPHGLRSVCTLVKLLGLGQKNFRFF